MINFSQLLNIKKEETKIVRQLYLFQLLQGAGVAMYFTIAGSCFLNRLGAGALPASFIAIAFFLWISASVYSNLERRLLQVKLNNVLLVTMSAIALAGLAFMYDVPSWFSFLMFAMSQVFFLLNYLKFWSLTASVFDVRQNKRLYNVFSAVNIPSKFLGFAVASILVFFITPEYLFLVSGLLIALSFIPMRWVQRTSFATKTTFKHEVEQSGKNPLQKYISFFISNKLVMHLALMSFVVYVAIVLINFGFFQVAALSFPDLKMLTFYFGVVMGAGQLISFIIKFIVTDKALNSRGSGRLLIVIPVAIALFVVCILSIHFGNSLVADIIIFGLMIVVADIMRNSILGPVSLSMSQPLSIHERLRSHTILKGAMEPFAYLVCGLLLMLFSMAGDSEIFIPVSILLCILIVLWIYSSRTATKHYRQSVVNNVELTLFTNREFSIRDKETLRMVEEKIISGDEVHVAHLIEMLAGDANADAKKIIAGGLKHPSTRIKILSAGLCGELKIEESLPTLNEILLNDENVELKSAVITALCNIKIDEQKIIRYLDDNNQSIRIAALTGILRNGNYDSRLHAENYLNTLIESKDAHQRLAAVMVLRQLNSGNYFEHLIHLINDSDKKVCEEAILAAGKIANVVALASILNKLKTNEQSVINALYNAGPISLPLIKSYVLSNHDNIKQNEKLVHLCGRIGTGEAVEVLFEFLEKIPSYKNIILKALYGCGFTASGKQKQLIEKIIRENLQSAVDLSNMMIQLQNSGHNFTLLRNALKIELNSIQTGLLQLFSFISDKNLIGKAASGFALNTKLSETEALHTIEITVNKSFSTPFIVLFENHGATKAATKLRHFPSRLPAKIEELIGCIFNNEIYNFNNWTKACAMYECRLNMIDIADSVIELMRTSSSPMLVEAAEFAA